LAKQEELTSINGVDDYISVAPRQNLPWVLGNLCLEVRTRISEFDYYAYIAYTRREITSLNYQRLTNVGIAT